jgi:hypothetical protein
VKKVRDHGRKVTHCIAQVPDGMGKLRVNQHTLAAAMKTKYDEGCLFVTVDADQILVSLWDNSPLAPVFPATRELLTPDGTDGGRPVTSATASPPVTASTPTGARPTACSSPRLAAAGPS